MRAVGLFREMGYSEGKYGRIRRFDKMRREDWRRRGRDEMNVGKG